MYSLLQQRHQFKYLALQMLLLGISSFATERFVDILVEEKHLFPESFALESIIFLIIWFGLDLCVSSVLKFRSFLQSLTNRTVVANRGLITLAIAWFITALFFQFYSFMLEFAAMLALWWVLDFLGSKIGRKAI